MTRWLSTVHGAPQQPISQSRQRRQFLNPPNPLNPIQSQVMATTPAGARRRRPRASSTMGLASSFPSCVALLMATLLLLVVVVVLAAAPVAEAQALLGAERA